VATQYAPAPLLPPSHDAEQTQRSSTFPRRIRSHADAAAALRVKAALSKAALKAALKVTLTFDLLTLKVVSVRVMCDVGYLFANFGLPRPLCSRLRPDARDRQTSDKSIA